MKHFPLLTIVALASMFPCFAAVHLEGKVLRLDSLPKPGVVVALSGTNLSDTTDAAGEWSLVGAASGILRGTALALPVSSHLVLRNGRIQMSLAGRNVLGAEISGASPIASVPPIAMAGRSSGTDEFDTLVYSWNGKVILRDTIARDSLVRKEIVRHFDTTVNPAITHGYVTDVQSHVYRTVTIGKQTWMAENLNYKLDGSWCYANAEDSCNKFGRLYRWSAVMKLPGSCDSVGCANQVRPNHQGICPNGWHVPSYAEWDSLASHVDGVDTSGGKLKSSSGWAGPGNGRDTYGFRGLPGGYRYNGFNEVARVANFWSSTEYDVLYTWIRNLHATYYGLYRNANLKIGGYSVRCIKD